jgi:hypothetical protein
LAASTWPPYLASLVLAQLVHRPQRTVPLYPSASRTFRAPRLSTCATPRRRQRASKAPEGAPNVVIVLVDDMGFRQSSGFGGPFAEFSHSLYKFADALFEHNSACDANLETKIAQ